MYLVQAVRGVACWGVSSSNMRNPVEPNFYLSVEKWSRVDDLSEVYALLNGAPNVLRVSDGQLEAPIEDFRFGAVIQAVHGEKEQVFVIGSLRRGAVTGEKKTRAR